MSEERASSGEKIALSGGGGRALALIPVLVALLVGALVMPRSAVPDAIPMPMVDGRVLARVESRDRELAAEVNREPLPSAVRALGSAIREFNLGQAHSKDDSDVGKARDEINKALAPALEAGVDKLIALRAWQAEAFLAEVRRFEATGQESDELASLGGPFVKRMRLAGWCDEKNRLVLDDAQRRVAFKATWNAVIGLEGRPDLQPSLDETRALYVLYLQHPHAAEPIREQLASARLNAKDPKQCAELEAREANAVEVWRLEKIRKLGALDTSYPLDYALGVANFRRGQFPAAAESFRTWLKSHPDGAWSLRARNYMKAAVEAAAY